MRFILNDFDEVTGNFETEKAKYFGRKHEKIPEFLCPRRISYLLLRDVMYRVNFHYYSHLSNHIRSHYMFDGLTNFNSRSAYSIDTLLISVSSRTYHTSPQLLAVNLGIVNRCCFEIWSQLANFPVMVAVMLRSYLVNKHSSSIKHKMLIPRVRYLIFMDTGECCCFIAST